MLHFANQLPLIYVHSCMQDAFDTITLDHDDETHLLRFPLICFASLWPHPAKKLIQA